MPPGTPFSSLLPLFGRHAPPLGPRSSTGDTSSRRPGIENSIRSTWPTIQATNPTQSAGKWTPQMSTGSLQATKIAASLRPGAQVHQAQPWAADATPTIKTPGPRGRRSSGSSPINLSPPVLLLRHRARSATTMEGSSRLLPQGPSLVPPSYRRQHRPRHFLSLTKPWMPPRSEA